MLLIIDRKNTTLRYENNSLRVERPNKPFQRVPLKQLDQVIVYGNPLAETSVWRHLAANHVPVSLLPTQGHHQAAAITGHFSSALRFRRRQHLLANQQALALDEAQYFLQLKFNSYRLPLSLLQQHNPLNDDESKAFLQQISNANKRIQYAESSTQLMGIEGQLARVWFSMLRQALPSQWKFTGRNRMPPLDPVNALLSLGYTLIANEIEQLILSSGFDPALGFLHQSYPGRSALVLDFTECFRAAIDYFVLQLVFNQVIEPSHFFYRQEQGCRLNKQARPLFFQAWAGYRYQWPRPFNPHNHDNWPHGYVKEIINGQIMRWRDRINPHNQQQEANHEQ